MQTMDADSNLVALLDWYRAMGVDTATGDEAVDWPARGASGPGTEFRLGSVSDPSCGTHASGMGQTPGRPGLSRVPMSDQRSDTRAPAVSDPDGQTPGKPAPRPFTPPPAPGAAETAARQTARGAKNLAELGAALAKFEGCGLKSTAKNLCFYRGVPQTKLMLIGEAPGREEDLEGKPFAGRAGQLLDRMLAAIGHGEESVHITNIVYWRPPGNRTPSPQEAEACRPFLERQVELVAPDVVVLLGGAAAKQVLGLAEGIMRLRGRWHEVNIGSQSCRAIATLHPAYLLRTPAAKRLAWRDLLAIKAALHS